MGPRRRRSTWGRHFPSLLLALAQSVGASGDLETLRAQKEANVAAARAALQRAEEELAAFREDSCPASSSKCRPGRGEMAAEVAASTCNARIQAANVSAAAEYVAQHHARRALHYLQSAQKRHKAGLRQLQGKDKSNPDPFIKQYDGFNQLLAALDLSPRSADVWLAAGKAALGLATLTEGSAVPQALAFLALGCRLDPSNMKPLLAWLQEHRADADAAPGEQKATEEFMAAVASWLQRGEVPDLPITAFPAVDTGICLKESTPSASSVEVLPYLRQMHLRPVFPTYVASMNLLALLPAGFADRLADLAVAKYKDFAALLPNLEPNDLNDRFFNYQVTDEVGLKDPEAVKTWPEMYKDSTDFQLLITLMKSAMIAFLEQSGVTFTERDAQEYRTVLWAAVYPGNGGRHGFHAHQGSLSSCVFYARTSGFTTPIIFADPRGAPPVNDYERYHGEHDFEPVAPFHHSEYFFPQKGDLVCFPSWLIHSVPSHRESDTRVAFAANLQGQAPWDSWARTIVNWT